MPRKKVSKTPSRVPRSRPHAKAIAANPFSALLRTVQKDVDTRLSAYFDARLEQASEIAPEVAEMVSALFELCRRGGKRLRPALLVAGYRAASTRADLDVALDAGMALELLQAYLLIHDDWMDGDATRRGGPSVHTVLGRRLKDQHKGDSAAILAGDYASALATELLSELELPSRTAPRIFGCFARMQLSAIAGQQMDLVARSRDIERAYALKTGSYTVQGPLELGALLARGSTQTLRVLERFAHPLGIAFQLQDDLLSAFGDPKKTGKPVGNDLRAGKRTLLLVKTLARTRGADRALLQRVIGNSRAKERELRAGLALMESCGAREEVERRVDELAAQALATLEGGVTSSGRELLVGAVETLTQRRY